GYRDQRRAPKKARGQTHANGISHLSLLKAAVCSPLVAERQRMGGNLFPARRRELEFFRPRRCGSVRESYRRIAKRRPCARRRTRPAVSRGPMERIAIPSA